MPTARSTRRLKAQKPEMLNLPRAPVVARACDGDIGLGAVAVAVVLRAAEDERFRRRDLGSVADQRRSAFSPQCIDLLRRDAAAVVTRAPRISDVLVARAAQHLPVHQRLARRMRAWEPAKPTSPRLSPGLVVGPSSALEGPFASVSTCSGPSGRAATICPDCLTLREKRAIRAEKARVLRRLKRGQPPRPSDRTP